MTDFKQKERGRRTAWDALYVALGVALIAFSVFTMLSIASDADRLEVEIAELRAENTKLSDSLAITNDRIADIYKLSWDNINYWIDYFNIENPEIVRAQIYEETGNLTSSLALNNHNLFGMKMPSVRQTSALYAQNGFAYYGSYIESIYDYKLWQMEYYNGEQDYYEFLTAAGYCFPDAEGYIRRLKRIVFNGLTVY